HYYCAGWDDSLSSYIF
nr:immunoglobulin light chain junction region [Macaca mulatta]MOX44603.1 immunoglobulin light chain junction region [Macaca mulatta]